MKNYIFLLSILLPQVVLSQNLPKAKTVFIETNLTRFTSSKTIIVNQLENYDNIPEEWNPYIYDNLNYKFTFIDGNDTTMSAARYVNFSHYVDFRGATLGLSREIYSKNKWQSNVAGGLSFSQANYMYHIPLLRNQITTHIGDTINNIPIYENNRYEVQAFKEVKRLGIMLQNEIDYKVLNWLSVSFNIRQNLWLKYTDDLSYKGRSSMDTSFYRQNDISHYFENSADGNNKNRINQPKPTEGGYDVLTRKPSFQYDLQPMFRLSVSTKQKIGMYAQMGFPMIIAYGKDFDFNRKDRSMNLRSIPKQLGFGITYGF